MSFWSRLLRYATSEEMAGKSMEDPDPWLILPQRDPVNVLRYLSILFPEGGFVYFEDTTNKFIKMWLSENSVPAPIKVAIGTIWPKPDYYHIPLTQNLLLRIADVSDENKIYFPSIHLHVHNGEKVLCEWHDAIACDPILVSSNIPKEKIDAFANAISADRVMRKSEERQNN